MQGIILTTLETLTKQTAHSVSLTPNIYPQIYYGIVGNAYQFKMDRQSGDVILAKPLDYETRKSYRLEIRAYNNFDGLQEKEDRGIVTVIVNDVNDERPKFKHNR